MMKLSTHLAIATMALRANLLRSLLTIGGLAVGIASLIGLSGIGSGFTSAVSEEMAALGTHLFVVEARSPAEDRRANRKPPGTLVAADAGILGAIAGVAHAVPVLQGQQIALGDQGNTALALIGSEPGFAVALRLRAAAGRLLADADEAVAEKSVVLGARAARILLGSQAADKVVQGRAEITVGRALLRVIGILEPMGSFAGWNIDDTGFVPFSTARLRLLGSDRRSPLKVDAIVIDLARPEAKQQIGQDVKDALREQHRIGPRDSSDFALVDLAASARAEGAILGTIKLFLMVMAGTTILVSGAGIVNIMLVAVNERKSEIGLLQALGARRGDILAQFLIEAVIMAIAGGMAGSALGMGGGECAELLFGLRFHVEPWSIPAAVLGAGLVGIAAGLVPAHRASRLSPLAALNRPA